MDSDLWVLICRSLSFLTLFQDCPLSPFAMEYMAPITKKHE